ncbi:uncharacterized protein [Drosophila takahashii]|uniref:uncharacterized protein n=1 Tax=Drosophila takahashii TaxID=29030 RepID=UPI003899117D
METPKTITDITHYDLFRILDIIKADCEMQNANESMYAIKYADIFNLAVTCKILRRVVWDWSREMYDRLEIDLLHVMPLKKWTVQFIEIHESLKRASQKKRDQYMDIYIKAMMGNPLLKTVILSYKTEKYIREHESIFDEIIKGLQGKAKRIILDPERMPKCKEIIVDIADHQISGLGQFRNISKLSITASFEVIDLVEFCCNNPSLVSLEVNVNRFSDQGKLTQIVRHCPNLKQLKFQLNDNVWDNGYVGLALLQKLQHLEIEKPPVPEEFHFLLPDEEEMEIDEELTSKRSHKPQQMDAEADFTSKRSRMDPEYESLIEGVSNLEQSIPVLQLLRAFSEKKKSKLIRLCLKFDIDDEMAEVIGKIKGLRMLECGFCDPKSIRHFVRHPTLNRLSILNRGHLVTDDIAEILSKQVTISSFDAKMFLSVRGHLGIWTRDAEIYRYVNFEPFVKLENLKTIGLSNEMLVSMESQLLRFLELGVLIKASDCEISLQPQTRELKMFYSRDYVHEEFPLPWVKNVRSFKVLLANMPTPHLFLNLSTINLKTMQEIYIGAPYSIFAMPKDGSLNKSGVEALATLRCLRKITCGLQKFIYILPLAELKDLEDLVILSEHHPKDVYFPKCLEPLLKNCRKLNSFQIKVPVNGITKKFFASLQNAVVKYRQEEIDIIICLKCQPYKTLNEMATAPNLKEKQIKLITRQFELMKLTTKYIENEYLLD